MLDAAIAVMRERGAVGLSVDEVLARSGAPRGSVYHHFPGGRAELLRRTVEHAGESYTGMIERAAAGGAPAAIERMVRFWREVLVDSDFRAGCPIVAAAVNPGPGGDELAGQAAAVYDGWHRAVADAFAADGASRDRADALATTVLAALDGAVSLSRVRRDLAPLDTVAATLRGLAAEGLPTG
ncbi:HTH tetR-type domain-containing protein [Tsukamurella ocularis]